MATQRLEKGPTIGQVDFPLTLLTDSDATGDGVGLRIMAGDLTVGAITCTLTDIDNGQLKGQINILTVDEGGDGLVARSSVGLTGTFLAGDGTAAAPSYSFSSSDSDDGMYLDGSAVTFATGGVDRVLINSLGLTACNGTGPALLNKASTATIPTLLPDRSENGTGIGGTANNLSLVVEDIEVMRGTSAGALFGLGYQSTAQTLTPAADGSAGSVVLPHTTAVDVGAVTNDADDWILLPSLSAVPVGHNITVMCNAGTAFEIRTPASSSELINTVDADGTTAELTAVDTEMIVIQKVSAADGWVARSVTALGADNTALVPSA